MRRETFGVSLQIEELGVDEGLVLDFAVSQPAGTSSTSTPALINNRQNLHLEIPQM
jgi:hypothetical protein